MTGPGSESIIDRSILDMSDHGSLFYLSNFRGTLHYTLSDFNIDRRAKGVSYRYVEIDQCE